MLRTWARSYVIHRLHLIVAIFSGVFVSRRRRYIAQLAQRQWQQMCFSRENECVQIERNFGRISKHKIQILECLRKYKRIHSIFMLARSYIIDRGKSARYSCMILQCFQHFLRYLQVVMITGCLV